MVVTTPFCSFCDLKLSLTPLPFRRMADIRCQRSKCMAQNWEKYTYGVCCVHCCKSFDCPEDAWRLCGCKIRCSISIWLMFSNSFSCISLIMKIRTGDAIVQNGATSIVGQCLIQLARDRGIRSINIIRDRYHLD